jgi:DNA primase
MTGSDASFRECIDQIKDKLRVDDVVRDYVPSLTQRGSSYKGLCPFHKEKTPSFHVHPELGFYHCFGCGAHGDVIKFVQEIEKIDFRLAIEQLARRAGVAMPSFSPGHDRTEEEDRRLDRLRELCTWAGEFFIEQMRVHPRGGQAREYLKRRGLTDEDIKAYRLGYAPDGYEVLLNAAEKRGWKPETVAEAGLASRRDAGGFTDRFRDRVIFPIADRMGQVVAFAGRLLADRDDAPKYINSAETPIFKKNQVLYGMAAAREPIRTAGQAILIEGYMDWISMHRHGLGNALAGMGTALTEEQARMLRRITGRVTLLYDADAAGQKAMFRATELLLKQGLAVHAAVLPGDHDPDTYLIAEGSQAMRDLIEQAPPALDHWIESAAMVNDLGRPEGKAMAVQQLAPLLLAIEEPALREGYLTRAAGRLGLQTETLQASLRRRQRRPLPADRAVTEEKSVDQEAEPNQTEQNLLYILLQSRDPWDELQQVEPEWFQHSVLRGLYERIYVSFRDVREGADPPEDLFSLGEDEQFRAWLSRVLLLPVRRFGGEVEDFNHFLAEAMQLQVLKLRKQAAERRKRQLSQDLQLILGENPLGAGQLAEIHQLSRENVQQWTDFLDATIPPDR